MKRPSNSALLAVFTKLMILLLLAKLISFGLWLYLPHDSVELTLAKNYQPQYRKVDFKSMLENLNAPQKNAYVASAFSGTANITNMVLKGLFGNQNKGFVIVALKSSPTKTSIISVGDIFKGYTLKSITLNGSIFEKDGNEYTLYLKQSDYPTSQYIKSVQQPMETQIGVTRTDIADYIKNPKGIWDDISIIEDRDGRKLKGFKVTKINKKSKLASLGLSIGDVIIKANNLTMDSYANVLTIYKQINTLDSVQLVVIRNNQEVELVYEIN